MENEENWSVAVENLVDGGDVEAAISLLETVVSKLDALKSSSSDLQLAVALADLANLYSSRGLSSKADECRTLSVLVKIRVQKNSPRLLGGFETVEEKLSEDYRVSAAKTSAPEASASSAPEASASSAPEASASSDDDWEALADCASDALFSPKNAEGISKLSLEDTEFQTPKRRGRGSFLYDKNVLYSDEQPTPSTSRHLGAEDNHILEEKGVSRYGTSHVLVLADFPPITRTTELEKLFENFKDRGVAIRWVNDTVALAVFRSPPIALEAQNSIHCSFTVRTLTEEDRLVWSICAIDLEPPIVRPKTSVRTAQRLIAHGMGMKLSELTLGASEFRKQEEARRNRIVTRQTLRDDAWGAD